MFCKQEWLYNALFPVQTRAAMIRVASLRHKYTLNAGAPVRKADTGATGTELMWDGTRDNTDIEIN